MIDKDVILDLGRYLFDGFLVAFVWVESNLTLLSTDALWTETFGNYANSVKISIQVIITAFVAITAFFRMLIMIRKYRQNKLDKKTKQENK